MPYVKISDPNTIDLASWQQVVNVVNQHSDSISAITNNFGAQNPTQSEWNTTEDFAYEYDPNSQKIIFGRTALEIKSSIGAIPVNMSGFIYHNNKFVTKYIKQLFKKLEPTLHWQQRNPFK